MEELVLETCGTSAGDLLGAAMAADWNANAAWVKEVRREVAAIGAHYPSMACPVCGGKVSTDPDVVEDHCEHHCVRSLCGQITCPGRGRAVAGRRRVMIHSAVHQLERIAKEDLGFVVSGIETLSDDVRLAVLRDTLAVLGVSLDLPFPFLEAPAVTVLAPAEDGHPLV